MRRVRQKSPSNSLDLLLDTMCNAFGGIILIAIMIVLLSSDVVESPVSGQSFPDKDSIERQIATAQKTISDLHAQKNSLETDPMAAEAASLRQRIEQARESLASERERSKNQEGVGYLDYSSELARLRHQQREAELKLTQTQNEIKALENRKESIQRQIDALEKNIQEMLAARVEEMRLPKERDTTLRAMPVIFLYNEIFWMHPEGQRNTESIDWRPLSDESFRVSPIRGKGWQIPRDQSRIHRALAHSGGKAYVAGYVFPDSVETFRKFRQQAITSGVEIGWSLETSVDGLIFGARGTSPAPQ
jgi:hypothetical protein